MLSFPSARRLLPADADRPQAGSKRKQREAIVPPPETVVEFAARMPAAVPRMMQRFGADFARMAPAVIPLANAGNAGLGYVGEAATSTRVVQAADTDAGKRRRACAPQVESEEVIACSSPPIPDQL